ncbi:MAG: NAD(P)-binding domain-containing protein, partial [Alphaproteobacteria bacterium]|nr:NAD(P)-binding domain-containing protein [Alphaproteobacteria bacterium]
MKIGFLHPGSMGVSIAASAIASGHAAFWASQGRGSQTRARAAERGLVDLGSIEAVCRSCDMVFSICPPAAAEDVAEAVAACSFGGIYMDGNAISPERMANVARIVGAGGAHAVDGAIIGPPAWQPGTTFIYFSGSARGDVAGCFTKGAVTAEVMSDRIGEASALKMCYAALTKGTAALL